MRKKSTTIISITVSMVFFAGTVLGVYSFPVNEINKDEVTAGVGNHWTSLGLERKVVYSLAATKHYLYAGTDGEGVFRKDLVDLNSSWEYLGFVGEIVKCVYVDPLFPQTIYVGLGVYYEIINESGEPHSLYVSYNGGQTWIPCDEGIEWEDEYSGEVYRLPVLCVNGVSGDPLILYASSIMQIFKSTDGGNSWNIIYGDPGSMGVGIHVISIDSLNAQRLWAGGETAILNPLVIKSLDGGQNWDWMTPDMGGDNACYTIVVHPQDSNIVYAGMEGSLIKTIDGGGNWTFVLSPPDGPYFQGLVLDPLEPDRIFAGGGPNAPPGFPLKVWVSCDGGQSWQCMTVVEGEKVRVLVLDRINHDVLYAGTQGTGVWRYHNHPPETPTRPSGPIWGVTNRTYSYTTNTTDPDRDQIYYNFSWDDGTFSGWLGPFDSDETVSASHAWANRGIYLVKVKARDTYGAESDWAYLEVKMAVNQHSNDSLFLRFLERFPNAFPILRFLLSK